MRTLAAGGALLVVGLAADALLHDADASGHPLAGAGHVLAALGLTIALLGLARGAATSRPALYAAPIAVLAGTFGAWAATGAERPPPDPCAGPRPVADADPLAALAAVAARSAPVADPSVDTGEGHHPPGDVAPAVLDDATQALLDAQLACAGQAARAVATLERAEAAGYVQSSTNTAGIGMHFTDWSAVALPFDPARPSQLLFADRRHGRPPELVGLSYWVTSESVPDGFAGPDDHWHRHAGLCFVDGWLREQGLARRSACDGEWVEGSDLWMLHAWVVDGVPNRWGVFADINPALCSMPASTPDVLRCPER